MSEWQPIETAPKDGTVIDLTAIEDDGSLFEIWRMMWGHIKQNGLFPETTGMWMTPDGMLTWNAHPTLGGGPTHWVAAWTPATPDPGTRGDAEIALVKIDAALVEGERK